MTTVPENIGKGTTTSALRERWNAYGVVAVLIVVIIVATSFGFAWTTDNRWSAPLVGITAIVAVLALGENQRMRQEMAASVDENRQMRLVMHETLRENKLMREFTEKARAQDVRPTVRIDWVEYRENGDYATAIVFRNWGPGVAVLREVRFLQIQTEDAPDTGPGETDVNTLHHGYHEIVVWPKEAVHTTLRGSMNSLYLSAYTSTFSVVAQIYDINGERVEAYERAFKMALSDVFASNERGRSTGGEWLNDDGQIGGIG